MEVVFIVGVAAYFTFVVWVIYLDARSEARRYKDHHC